MYQRSSSRVLVISLVVAALLSMVFVSGMAAKGKTDREKLISLKETIIAEMVGEGKYNCCLEEPCLYCIVKSPGHGEGAACTCTQDVVTGQHPCGECMGEILEGEAAESLAPYLASALADELGAKYLLTLKKIISDKYEISIEAQKTIKA